jgi:hypothetical protein
VKGERLVARVHAHPSMDGSQNRLSSLRYFGLPPARPLRLALVDPTDKRVVSGQVTSAGRFTHK